MDKYLQLDHLELSEDPSFIRWAKGAESRDDNDWDRWLVNHPEMQEIVDKAKSIVLAMKFVQDQPTPGAENRVWGKISSDINTKKIDLESRPKKAVVKRLLPFVAVAALALLLLIFNIGNEYDTSVNVPLAKTETITLPDGSTVAVNADSKIAYNKASWNEKREVFLEGEAFFSVEKGSNFKVLTDDGTVQVLGTSFNVYSREDQLSVQCETGKVSVQTSGDTESILTPNQSVTVENGKHQAGLITETVRRSTWRDGTFVYKATKIIDVASELERQFDIKINMDKSLEDTKYTGGFNRSSLETALTEVFYPVNMKFVIKGKNVNISK
ncbi:MAG: FecR domain-containing protein [Bacteroidota bacterium]